MALSTMKVGGRLYLTGQLEALPTAAGEKSRPEILGDIHRALRSVLSRKDDAWTRADTHNELCWRSRNASTTSLETALAPLCRDLQVAFPDLIAFARGEGSRTLKTPAGGLTWGRLKASAVTSGLGVDTKSAGVRLATLAKQDSKFFSRDPAVRRLVESLDVRSGALHAFIRHHTVLGSPAHPFPELRRLDAFVGQEPVKEWAQGVAATQYLNSAFEGLGIPAHAPNRNLVLMGPPGSGKTTLGRALGHAFKALDAAHPRPVVEDRAPHAVTREEGERPEWLPESLKEDEALVEVTRADLVGGHIGTTAKHTQATTDHAAKHQKAMLVDEAHELHQPDSEKDFGGEAITGLMKAMEDGRGRQDFTLTGYEGPMNALLDSNPGMRRRATAKFVLGEMTSEQLGEALDETLEAKGLFIGNITRREVLRHLEVRRLGNGFGGAGEINNLLEGAIGRQRLRFYEAMLEGRGIHPTAAEQLRLTDFLPEGRLSRKPLDPFEGKIGLDQVRAKVAKWHVGIEGSIRRGESPLARVGNTFLFYGPPGTGKSTTAHALAAKAFDAKALPTAEVEVVDASKLTARSGKTTEQLTAELLERCRGKTVLFDEAYALPEGVVDTFVAQAETQGVRGRMVLIFAGYQDRMDAWAAQNEGLFSRTRNQFEFVAFSAVDAATRAGQLFDDLQKESGVGLTPAARDALPDVLAKLAAAPKWASGRDVETFVDKAIVEADARAPLDTGVDAVDLENALEEMLSDKNRGPHRAETAL